MKEVVRVGIGTMIFKGNTLLFGLRTGSRGKHHWCLPGGHLEFGETPEECALRETREETGLVLSDVKRGPWIHDFFRENNSQYVTLLMVGCYAGGDPVVMERDKFEKWEWFPSDKPPSPLFLPLQTFCDSGYRFSDFNFACRP